VRLWKGVLAGVVAAGLAGCTSSANTPPPGTPVSTAPATTARAAPPVNSVPAGAKADVRAAAAQFDTVYFADRFAAAWDLLAPTVQRQVSKEAWVGVHNACPSAASGTTSVIKSVTVFGGTAIVTETARRANSTRGTIEYVFYYSGSYWGYSPANPGIYRRGSVAADIAAAKAAGLCGGWRAF
jgi:hypothetical protein